MPLISVVGRRSLSMRLLVGGMYVLLMLGALTMIYPFALMFSTATTSQADCEEFQLVPEYWRSDLALFKKYLVDCVDLSELSVWFAQKDWFDPRDVRLGQLAPVADIPDAHAEAMAQDWWTFLSEACPDEFKLPMFIAGTSLGRRDSPLSLQNEYLAWLKDRYKTVDALNDAYTENAVEWSNLTLPTEILSRRVADDPRTLDYRRFVTTRPPDRMGVLNLDALVYDYLAKIYGSAERLAKETGCRADALTDVTYEDLRDGRLGDDAKRLFFARFAPSRYVRVDVARAAGPWRQLLQVRGKDVSQPLPERMPTSPKWAGLWGVFVQRTCPLDALDVARPEEAWWEFLAARYSQVAALNDAWGTDYAGFNDVRISPVRAVAAWRAFRDQFVKLKWRYLTHNFVTVFKFVAVHGKALQVTAIYILLMIGATLTINPLAAYALSRFRLKETHHILLFLLATMAFPSEVLMIPNLLLIKEFPIVQIALVAACLVAFALLKMKLGRRLPLVPAVTIAFAVTAFLAGWAVPHVAGTYDAKLSVSLMNTFWALILPSMANGYGIFLLKGFFDSLPPELYEAGLIDGAGELRMFWQITLPLCKPIMAVMALGAFTAAYGAFMHAFLVCQDPKMWTFMVFLYEFQQNHSVPMVMASLVVAAVPTLTVFIFCQRVILRGIVIPTFK